MSLPLVTASTRRNPLVALKCGGFGEDKPSAFVFQESQQVGEYQDCLSGHLPCLQRDEIERNACSFIFAEYSFQTNGGGEGHLSDRQGVIAARTYPHDGAWRLEHGGGQRVPVPLTLQDQATAIITKNTMSKGAIAQDLSQGHDGRYGMELRAIACKYHCRFERIGRFVQTSSPHPPHAPNPLCNLMSPQHSISCIAVTVCVF